MWLVWGCIMSVCVQKEKQVEVDEWGYSRVQALYETLPKRIVTPDDLVRVKTFAVDFARWLAEDAEPAVLGGRSSLEWWLEEMPYWRLRIRKFVAWSAFMLDEVRRVLDRTQDSAVAKTAWETLQVLEEAHKRAEALLKAIA